MSVFRVKLQNATQGQLDRNPSTASSNDVGLQMDPSIQRTVYVTGPNHTYRKLKDGDVFTDCNYWKRFSYPQLPEDQAFIEVVTDDGSIYSDVPSENTYPKVYDLSIENGTTFTNTNNVVDILGDTGGYAVFVQITNMGGTAVKCRLNGITDAIFDLDATSTQIFSYGDLSISKLEFSNTVSGGSDTDVQVLLSVRSMCYS
jgi:hypothetical protein